MADLKEARVPDIGGYDDVPVIEVLVGVGDTVQLDQGLVTLESDKATMEVPAPFAGVIRELKVKLGDKVSEGGVVALIEATEAAPAQQSSHAPASRRDSRAATRGTRARQARGCRRNRCTRRTRGRRRRSQTASPGIDRRTRRRADRADTASRRCVRCRRVMPDRIPYASPAVRLLARELGVDLAQVTGSQRGGRIGKEDVQAFVKQALAGGAVSAPTGGGLQLLPWPKVDFAKFGEIETRELSRIQKLSGANLARNWAMIPHVTQHDDADVTELETLRVALNKENEKNKDIVKLTMLAFLIKASVAALQKYPDFNASLDASGGTLTLKKYFHIGFAADTPNGLVVPVVRDCDRKGVLQIARETSELAAEGARRQARPGRHAGRLLLDQLARWHRWHVVHPDRQRAGSRHPRCLEGGDETGLERQRVRAAAAVAAVAVLRPPRDRWRRRGALHRISRAVAGRHAARAAVRAGA